MRDIACSFAAISTHAESALSSLVRTTAGPSGRVAFRPRTTPITTQRVRKPRCRAAVDAGVSGFTFAAVEYTHDFMGGNCAVIGGHVYRGTRYPELFGTYLAADHSGVLWAMPQKAVNPDSFDLKFLRPLCAVDSPLCTTTVGNIFTIGQDRNKDLYYSTSTVRRHSACREACHPLSSTSGYLPCG